MYEWDKAKSVDTFKRRGFGFEIIEGFLWDYALCVEIQDHDDEQREKWIGPIGNSLYVAIMIPRDEIMRVVSLRYATQAEITLWRKETSNG